MREAQPEAAVQALAEAAKRRKPAVFLIGAGCSLTGGVPLARDVVEYVRVNYPTAYQAAERRAGGKRRRHADGPSYPDVMRSLSWHHRYFLFNHMVGLSRLNWAHLGLAYLMRHGYAGRVLTTNFDDLILRACALYGCHPAVHDLGLAAHLFPSDVETKEAKSFAQALKLEPAVYYLHGRHNGFFQAHSTKEVDRQAEHLAPVVDAAHDRTWIVVGYSGDSDPLFKTLQRLFPFPGKLFWVNLREPGARVASVLNRSGNAAFVRIGDADAFFLRITGRFMNRRVSMQLEPFLQSIDVFDGLSPIRQRSSLPPPSKLGAIVREASARLQKRQSEQRADLERAQALLHAGRYDELIRRFGKRTERHPLRLNHALAQAYLGKGDAIMSKLPRNPEERHATSVATARRCYGKALELVAGSDQVLRSWAETLKRLGPGAGGRLGQEEWRRRIEERNAARELDSLRMSALEKWSRSLVQSIELDPRKEFTDEARLAGKRIQDELRRRSEDPAPVRFALGDVLRARVRLEGGDRPKLMQQARNAYQRAFSLWGKQGRNRSYRLAQQQLKRLRARFAGARAPSAKLAALDALRLCVRDSLEAGRGAIRRAA